MSNNSPSANGAHSPEERQLYNIVVISGPSGSGKSTLVKHLMSLHPELEFSVSHTTRPIRGREVDGVDYHFTTVDEFKRMIASGSFVEHAMVYGNYYGTSLREVESKGNWKSGKFLALDIDVQGARIVRDRFPDALFILVSPPSMPELQKRLTLREGKLDDVILNRLRIARNELEQFDFYDYIIINDQLEEAKIALEAIYIAYRHRTPRQADAMRRVLDSGANLPNHTDDADTPILEEK